MYGRAGLLDLAGGAAVPPDDINKIWETIDEFPIQSYAYYLSRPPDPTSLARVHAAAARTAHPRNILYIMDNEDFVEKAADITLNDTVSSTTYGTPQKKRENYLDWTEYFMATAFLAAKRSKDPSYQVGACVVNKEKKIVGIGYNGMPIGCHDDDFPWGKNTPSPLDSKYLYVCHAEMNAIINKNAADVRDCTIYVGLFPCNECAKIIIQSGISEVVYMSDKDAHKPSNIASKRMFDAVGVKYWQYKPKNKQIVINFEVDWGNISPSN